MITSIYDTNIDSFSRLTKGGFYMTNSEDRMIQSIPQDQWDEMMHEEKYGKENDADPDKRYDVEEIEEKINTDYETP